MCLQLEEHAALLCLKAASRRRQIWQSLQSSLLLHVLPPPPGTAQGFLQLLHSLDTRIQPLLCCVAEANTAPDGSPRCCQLVFDMQSWQPLPWLFEDRGPEVPRRFAAQHCRCASGGGCGICVLVWLLRSPFSERASSLAPGAGLLTAGV